MTDLKRRADIAPQKSTRFYITDHAIERYRERVGSIVSDHKTRTLIRRMLRKSAVATKRFRTLIHGRDTSGREVLVYWVAEDNETVFVTVSDKAGIFTVVTCLKFPLTEQPEPTP